METKQSFSSWLGHQIKRRELSQREFAREAGVSPSSLSEWIRGVSIPDPASCFKIAEALRADPDMVLIYAGHRPNLDEDLPIGDPRIDLIELVRRVQWTEDREVAARAMLEAWIRRGKGRKE